ncbi:MAG: MFS transporter, partial [Candidatus Eremiobacterota bacterium]
MRHLLEPPPAAPPLPAEQVPSAYRYWRWRLLVTTFVGYAVYYFVRKNISVALPLMEKDLGVRKQDLGVFLTLNDLCYGVSKFVNGMVGDRTNPRYFMAVGLALSALVNVFFGLSSGLVTLGVFWILNGWFQGMGFPPCARILAHWFSPHERGVWWGVWNTSHQVGLAIIALLAGWLAHHYGWRAAFLGPALIALAVALYLAHQLRDTPASLGLPPVEEFHGGPRSEEDQAQPVGA